MHVVSAHVRVLADGTTSFVAEHVRWNRRVTMVAPSAAVVGQGDLFANPLPVLIRASEGVSRSRTMRGPRQLPLW